MDRCPTGYPVLLSCNDFRHLDICPIFLFWTFVRFNRQKATDMLYNYKLIRKSDKATFETMATDEGDLLRQANNEGFYFLEPFEILEDGIKIA